jgi:hypothetical protein
VVTDHRAHLRDALHSRFVVQLASGLRVSLGDNGLDAEAAAEEEQQRLEAERVSEQEFRQRAEKHAFMLAGARDSLEETRRALQQVGTDIAAANELLGTIVRDLPAAENRLRSAQRAINPARRAARAEVATWDLSTFDLRWAEGGAPLTAAQATEYLETTHHAVTRAEQAARDAGQAVSALREQREQLTRQIPFLVEHKTRLEEGLPRAQEWFEGWERAVWGDEYEAIQRVAARREPRERPQVKGLALWRARVAQAVTAGNRKLHESMRNQK